MKFLRICNPERFTRWVLIRWIRIRLALRLLGAGIIGALAFAYLTAGDIYEYQDSVDGVHLPQVDAVVCLAGGRGRISAAGDIWYRYWELAQRPLVAAVPKPDPGAIPILFVSGMGPQSNWGVLVRQVRRGVVTALDPARVVLETESSNTEENARWLVDHAKQRGWKRILLITSSYHMRRARFIFEGVSEARGHPLQIHTFSVIQEPFESEEWRSGFHGVRVTMIEFMKWIWYRKFWTP